jgi:hypothetical protein
VLQELHLHGMAAALEQQLADRKAATLRFEERLGPAGLTLGGNAKTVAAEGA